jgi:hypothetical protein
VSEVESRTITIPRASFADPASTTNRASRRHSDLTSPAHRAGSQWRDRAGLPPASLRRHADWTLSGTSTIVNLAGGLAALATADSAQVVQFDDNGTADHLWQFLAAGAFDS